jgi:putative aminopeptidase FrvX
MDLKLIEALSNANGISGFEDEVVEIIKDYVGDRLTVEVDHMNNMVLRYPKDEAEDDKKPIIMLDAHSDEIGFIVQAIKPNGTLKFLPIGGWSAQNIPAHLVRIRNREGYYIEGVVASKPPHFSKGGEGLVPIEELVIDIGAMSYDEVVNCYKIELGAPIVPVAVFTSNEKMGWMRGKAFDNRLGCSAVIETMLAFSKIDLPVTLVGAISSQEEVGLRGAKLNAGRIKPDLAIIFEGTPADDTFMPASESQGALTRGTQIRHFDRSMIANPRLTQMAITCAQTNAIAFQRAVREGGGTNAGAIHLADEGVPCLVLGTPVRYAHTHYGYSHIDDHAATIALAKQFINTLSEQEIERLTL